MSVPGPRRPPAPVIVNRDEFDQVEEFQFGEDEPWTIIRDEYGSIVSLNNGVLIKTILRDENGKIIGVSVTDYTE